MTLPFNAQSSPKENVIAFDWDDTLFSPVHGYNVDAFRAIAALTEQGEKVCIVTNRGQNAGDGMSHLQIAMGFMAAKLPSIPLEIFAKQTVKTDEFPYRIKLVVDNEDPRDPKNGYLPEGENPVVIRVGQDFSFSSNEAFLATVMTGLDVQQIDSSPLPLPTLQPIDR